MAVGQESLAKPRPPSRASGGWFNVRRLLLQVRRGVIDLLRPCRRFSAAAEVVGQAFEKRSPLYRETDPAEKRLELGKVHNLRLIAHRLDRIEVPAGEVFSFWKQVGRCSKRRGFVLGRQLQEGCLMPAVGGGICQLTNSLYAAALDAGLEIVERHPHTRPVPGASGPDATVAWNDIDLRFRSDRSFRIEVGLTRDELIVRIVVDRSKGRIALKQASAIGDVANSCATCGREECHHWHDVDRVDSHEGVAFLVDQWFPEFEPVVGNGQALLLRPLNGKKWNRPQYDWPSERFRSVRSFTFLTLRRAWKQRKLAQQGASRQTSLLEGAAELARAYAGAIPFDVRHVVVSQNLLPHLWQIGALGGRTFDVLMSRLPMAEIHRRLDEAARRHPERKLLSDFRAPEDLVAAEMAALSAADNCLTCHSEVASVLPNAVMLDWPGQRAMEWRQGRSLVFPGPTASRKGAYEVREVARRLGLEVVLLGGELEGPDFWQGIPIRRMKRSENWLDGALAVVQPAVIEDRPVALLKALASGCPVIATAACGLGEREGLTVVPIDDVESLVSALEALPSPMECGDPAPLSTSEPASASEAG